MSRLQEEYNKSIKTDLMSKLNLKNIHEVPKIEKIVINMGIGEGKDDSKLIDKAVEDLSLITGQKAMKTKARKAISGFILLEFKISSGLIGLSIHPTSFLEAIFENSE